jgi:hypothetical protein
MIDNAVFKPYYLIILLFCAIKPCSYGQELKITAKTDTISNEITTFVSLINISEGGRARFQQRLSPQAKLIKLPSKTLLWDTANNILTIITPKYQRIDTLNFTFVCRVDSLPNAILWGEAALMYENKAGFVKKITLPAKNYIVRQSPISDADSLTKGMYYIQVSASKSMQNKNEVAKLVRLKKEHIILEEKTEKFYKYFIGHFTTKEQASEQLKQYKQYVSDAFVVQF